jgi:hypothetical protein
MHKGAEKGLLKRILCILFISYDREDLFLHQTAVPAKKLNKGLLIAALRRRKQMLFGRERILLDVSYAIVNPPYLRFSHRSEANRGHSEMLQ